MPIEPPSRSAVKGSVPGEDFFLSSAVKHGAAAIEAERGRAIPKENGGRRNSDRGAGEILGAGLNKVERRNGSGYERTHFRVERKMAFADHAMRVKRRHSHRTAVDTERAQNLAGELEPLRIEPLIDTDDIDLSRLMARDGRVKEPPRQLDEARIVLVGERDHAPTDQGSTTSEQFAAGFGAAILR